MPKSLPPVLPGRATVGEALSETVSGLTRLHRLLLVTNARGEAVWMSDALRHRCGIDPDGPLASELDAPVDLEASHERGSLSASIRIRGGARFAFEGCALSTQAGPNEEPLTLSVLRATPTGGCHHDLRSAVSYLSAILDSAPDVVLAFDRDGFITYANAAVERLLGRAPREVLHKPVAMFVANPSDLDRLASELGGRGEVHDHDVDLEVAGGGTACVSISARTIRSGGGAPRIVGSVAFLRDVTERKRIEAELERKNAELEHYVQTVSHDLRSPLVSLLGFSRLLHQDYVEKLDDTGRHFLSRIEQAGRTMETLIHDLLEFSRIGRRVEERRLVDPRAILLQLKAELKPRLDEHDIALHLPASPPLLLCDRTRLYQVFSNLVGNAVDHMGPRPDAAIFVEVDEEPGVHHVRVRDNGRGIPPEDCDRVFEIFHTCGQRPDGQRSSGIGLAIVKKIAETHGGRVWVESEPGKGATFHFLLPRS